MFRELALQQENALTDPLDLATLGEIADHFASQAAFEDYRSRKAKNTLRRQDAELALFKTFLLTRGVEVGDLVNDPQAWQGVSWGIVAAFQAWLLTRGYAVGGINTKLSTIKKYSQLALKPAPWMLPNMRLLKTLKATPERNRNELTRNAWQLVFKPGPAIRKLIPL